MGGSKSRLAGSDDMVFNPILGLKVTEPSPHDVWELS